jgi:hypothetical protein
MGDSVMRRLQVLFFSVFFVFLFLTCDHDGGGAFIGTPELVRTTFEGEESEIGFITIPFLRDETEGLVVNAAADFNGDGVIASYEVDGRTQEEWIVQNTLMFIADTAYTVYFEIVDPGILPGDEVEVIVAAGESDVPSPWDGVIPEGAAGIEDVVTVGILDVENLVDPAPGGVGAGLVTAAQAQQDTGFGEPGDKVGTGPGGVGEILLRRGMPDAAQGHNTCVGHSIANSLSWLSRKCGFADRFQQDLTTPDGVVELGFALIDVYESVGGTLLGEDQSFGGVRNDKILEGKQKLTADLNLPIENRFLSRAAGEFKFNDIKQAMDDGCDVELILDMLDVETGSQSGLGHAFTLAGYAVNPDSKSIVVHDPGTKTFNDLHKLMETPRGGLTFIYNFEGMIRRARIEYLLIECCVSPQPMPTPPGTVPPTPEPTLQPPPEPTPMPTEPPIESCAEPGFYQSMSAGCSIGMFTLFNITGEGNLVVTGFGQNLGNVTFDKTDIETVFESVRTDLIIFGVTGHSCSLTCGPAADQLTLECERPGAMCTEVFTLQQ